MVKTDSWLEDLRRQLPWLVEETVRRQYEKKSSLVTDNDEGRDQALRDARFHLDYLLVSLENDSQILFNAYIQWAGDLYTHLRMPPDLLPDFFHTVLDLLLSLVKENQFTTAHYQCVEAAVHQAFSETKQPATSKNHDNLTKRPLQSELDAYTTRLLAADRSGAAALVHDLLGRGVDLKDLYRHLFHPFQLQLGHLWQQNKINVAQEHYATAATQYVMSLLYERILAIPKNDKVFLATCVSGELHEMGIRMVCDYLECCHWNTHYLGANTPETAVVEAVLEKKPDVVAVSCTMLYHLPRVTHLIRHLKDAGVTTPVLVGGYPFNIDPLLWQKTGADGTAGSFDHIYQTIESLTGGIIHES